MSALALPVDAPVSAAQQAWLSGFFAGLATARAEATAARDAANDAARPGGAVSTLTIDVLYGTQTGTSEFLADDLVTAARAHGITANLAALDDVTPETLAGHPLVLIVTSTYGEGEMPDNAELFWEALAAEGAPRLEGTEFAVLALGDSGYDDFCQAGKLLDLRFEQLGASRILDRVDCDVNGEADSAAWIARVVELLSARVPSAPVLGAEASSAAPAAPARTRSPWNRATPYPSRLAENRVVSGPGSAKEIRHIELALGDSEIEYHAGDALAVVPRNDPALISLLLSRLALESDADAGDGMSLGERLSRSWEIRTPSRELLALLSERAPRSELAELTARDDRTALDSWLWGKDVLDLLELVPDVRLDADDLASALRPLQHRAYSISSSPLHSPDRIHLTVAAVRHGTPRARHGVCSTFLADRADDADVGIFLQPNTAFRVPADDDAPMIMIGPGTGIAPFRAFLQERAARGARGRNWVFFGDQHRASDFIYADELDRFSAGGVLDRLDLAFSRDQAEKVYVQTRMREHGADLYRWLDDGGHLYVCGDATRMARDVETALGEVIADARGRGADDAAEYISQLKREKRYVRDVY